MRQAWLAVWVGLACTAAVGQEAEPAPATEFTGYTVALPDAEADLPTPLPKGKSKPGFALRGTKGWAWTPEQYLAEIPFLEKMQMNFLMNCYLSMFDIERSKDWAKDQANRWWEPLPEEKKAAYAEVIAACQERNIDFCFAMNPSLASSRPIDYHSTQDFEALWQHYAWAQSLGVKWFSLCLDDITEGIDAEGQAALVNLLLARLQQQSTDAKVIFCPTYYWGRGDSDEAEEYLATLAEALNEDVYCFWTGDAVVGPITMDAAQEYQGRIKHKLILWDNYPVNDGKPTMHLGPVRDREAALAAVIDGYMSNPMCTENEANRLPLATCADYAYNPVAYDPDRSIGQAILHAGETPAQRAVLKDLVELYPGMLAAGVPDTGYNFLLERFKKLLESPEGRAEAEALVARADDVSRRLAKAFPGKFRAERRTLGANIGTMRAALRRQPPAG